MISLIYEVPRVVKLIETEVKWKEGCGVNECAVSVLQDEKVLEMASDNSYTTNYCYSTIHLKMVKMVNYMLCVFYHNVRKKEEEREERRKGGREEGRKEGWKEGRMEGREGGREGRRKEGWKEGRMEKEGWKGGRKGGREEGWKEGRKEGGKGEGGRKWEGRGKGEGREGEERRANEFIGAPHFWTPQPSCRPLRDFKGRKK